MNENARQGFWNGSLPPIGYRTVAAEQRGAKVKKKLEIDPLHADTVRLIYRLALEGDGTTGQMGVKNIVSYLNSRRIFTRDGGRWGIGQLHRILARQRIRLESGGYRRDHLRALARRVEVADGEVRIMGSKSRLLQTLVAGRGVNSVPTQGLKWRRGWA